MDKDLIINDIFVRNIEKYIVKNRLISKKDRVLCSVSGGPDSVALLYTLFALKDKHNIELYVAHLEHGIREEESVRDQIFVKTLCKELGIPFYTKNIKVPKIKKGGESIEEVARRARLNFLKEVCKELKCNKIAIGHTLDDQIETILFRLINGTGQKGIEGINVLNKEIIRPLLAVTKNEVFDFLNRNLIEFVEDKTNYDIKYTRNRIRYRIIPEMEKINLRYRNHIDNFVELIREDNLFIEGLLKDYLKKVINKKNSSEISIKFYPFYEFYPSIKKRIILWAVSNLWDINLEDKLYLPYRVIKLITENKPQSNKTLYKNKFITIISEYDELVIKKSVVENINTEYLYSVKRNEKEIFIKEIGKKILFKIIDKNELTKFDSKILYLDLGKVKYPLIIRSRKPGDKINLPNLGYKKVKSIFINDKVKPLERSYVPIVLINGKVAGIFCSYYGKTNRISRNFIVDEKTEKVLMCSIESEKKI